MNEIDALVAEKVMGWRKEATLPEYFFWKDVEKGKLTYHIDDWKPSTNIKYAWEVVEKLGFPEYPFVLHKSYERYDHDKKEFVNPGFECRLGCECGTIEYCECGYSAWAKTAPLAICLAALKAVGVKTEVDE